MYKVIRENGKIHVKDVLKDELVYVAEPEDYVVYNAGNVTYATKLSEFNSDGALLVSLSKRVAI